MTENPYQSLHSQKETMHAPSSQHNIIHRLLRLLIGFALPIILLVVLHAIVCDAFIINRHDPEYIRILDNHTSHLVLLFLFSSVLTATVLGLPLVLYSGCLEFYCHSTTARLLAGQGFGGITSSIQINCLLLPFALDSGWEIAESTIHCLLPVAVLVGCSFFLEYFPSKPRAI